VEEQDSSEHDVVKNNNNNSNKNNQNVDEVERYGARRAIRYARSDHSAEQAAF
jgi:hypothetical protein